MPRVPAPEFTPSDNHLEALCRAIVYQQLSGKAANTIWNRFLQHFDGAMPEPSQVLSTSTDSLRSIGLSRQKATYVQSLAGHCLAGTVRIADLSEMSDEEVRTELTQVHGIGVWSADMFLMFTLCRTDIWPTLDLGIQKGAAIVSGQKEKLKPAELSNLGERWKPWRSIAAWYLWRVLEIAPPKVAKNAQ